MNRRDFLKIGAIGTTIGDISVLPKNHKSVIMLFLGGGISHIESWNPVPNAPPEYRSVVGAIQTNVPGILFGGQFQQQAKIADKMMVFHSFSHGDSGHSGGTHVVMTGEYNRAADNGANPIKPSVGSVVSRVRGENNINTGIPTYIRTGRIFADGAAYLGKPYEPFDPSGDGINNMTLTLDTSRLQDRRNLLKSFDVFNRNLDATGTARGMDAFERQSYDLILKSAKDAFDISKEDEKTRGLYGNSTLGQNLLLARRLTQSGAGFVTVMHGGWDHHTGIAIEWNRLSANLDHCIHALITDIYNKGLEKEVLLVISSEFGRTPKRNFSWGRDHWPELSSLVLVGGKSHGGTIYGQSNSKAEYPLTNKVSPQDLVATILDHVEVPLHTEFQDNFGRPIKVTDGRVIL
jgi:hypothetical protein